MSTIKQLKIFVTVAETGKMSDAAKKLYISQPTVSQTIIDLENEYGATLFERFPRELKITPSGRLFLDHALDVMNSYENLDNFMKNTMRERHLSVGATLTIGNTMLSDLVGKTISQYPDIDAHVLVENTNLLERKLILNEIDIALVEGIISHEKIYTEPFAKDTLVLICSPEHEFSSCKTLKTSDLRNQSFIMREKGSGTRAIFENLMMQKHIQIITRWECSSGTAIIDAVMHNLGIAIMSKRCVWERVKEKALHACELEDTPMNRYFYLCHNKNHPITSQMKNFIEICHSVGAPTL